MEHQLLSILLMKGTLNVCMAESLELPCKYCSLGCPEIFPYYSKLKHEAICNFRPYNCPYAGSECSVVGDIPYLVSHLRDDHKIVARASNSNTRFDKGEAHKRCTTAVMMNWH
ncbi:hypothetical protein RJ640_003995 [Escallonia rubra]|uniref:RING-type E3 ubiquitin transferase n=1 Tax=Escallonia rubra TaxID=112253 RepID=A0AA88UUF0_9ASTE|nr:hypothetical protein RJ640_003995 [Escallonia rubra]